MMSALSTAHSNRMTFDECKLLTLYLSFTPKTMPTSHFISKLQNIDMAPKQFKAFELCALFCFQLSISFFVFLEPPLFSISVDDMKSYDI